MVQCFPFQPVTHRQVPFLHWPCSLHRASQSFPLQYSPPQPLSHWQDSPTHRPCWPHSRSHSSANGPMKTERLLSRYSNSMPSRAFDLCNLRVDLPLSSAISTTYLSNSPRHSISVHRNRSACPNRKCHGQNSRAGIAVPPCPLSHNPPPSSPSCRCTFPRRSIRGPCTSDADSPLM